MQHACGDGGEVDELAMIEAALAAGQGEQRLDQLFLLLAYLQNAFAGAAEGLRGGSGVDQGHLQHGAFEGERRA